MKHHLETARIALLEGNKPAAVRALRQALSSANEAKRSDVKSYVMSALNFTRRIA